MTEMVQHAAVWLDRKQAKIVRLNGETFEETVIHAPEVKTEDHHRHRLDTGRRQEDGRYYHEIAKALADAKAVLVVGPSTAKLEFVKHVRRHDHQVEPKIVGVETVDHPTDAQLVAYARSYFSMDQAR